MDRRLVVSMSGIDEDAVDRLARAIVLMVSVSEGTVKYTLSKNDALVEINLKMYDIDELAYSAVRTILDMFAKDLGVPMSITHDDEIEAPLNFWGKLKRKATQILSA